MDLLQLRYFQVVARVEHMTKAAEELYIAQPSLSKTIHRLEKEIGVSLFDRQGRSIRLNQFGKVFLAYIDRLFHELEEGKRQVRDMAGLEHGEVSLVAASLHWLPDVLRSFQSQYPLVHFRFSHCGPSEMVPQLEAGTCDFCFPSAPLVRPGIKWKTLLIEDVLLVVPKDHRLAAYDSVPFSEIAQESIVIEKVGGDLRGLIDDFCQQAGFTPRITYEIDEPLALLEFASAHLGVTFIPAFGQRRVEEQS